MHRHARALLGSLPILATLLATRTASADVANIGVGVIGAFGGNFLGKPSDLSGQDAVIAGAYPGFGGTTSGYGLMADLRLLGFLGLELDAIKMSNHAHGDVTWTVNGTTYPFTVEIGQDAWHVPILAKVVLPSPLIAPFAELGPEFVFVGTPTATATSGTPLFGLSAAASNYTMFTFGLGFELKLPIPSVDIRIPLTLRGSYNPSVSSHITDRQTLQTSGNVLTGVQYNSQFQWQALGTLGAAIYF
jgi:hypothetical protein